MSLEENMNSHTGDPWGSSIPDKHRCRFTNARSIRCSNRLFDTASGMCSYHARIWLQESADDAKATAELLIEGAPDLLDRDEIHVVLARLFRFVAEKRIEQSRGSLLAYITSLVLQTLPHREPPVAEDDEKPEFQVVWDIPPAVRPALQQNETNNSDYPPDNGGPQA